jgi:hypothetical protein
VKKPAIEGILMATSKLEILDTFPAFLTYWEKCRDLPLDAQIERWAQDYLSPWTELLAMQVEDYHDQNIDWQSIARERIFPHLSDWLPAMRLARENLLVVSENIFDRTASTLGVNMQAVYIIHVGIGCGAGWVTRYQGSAAVLFGLENIAESGWHDRDTISGLIAHELGHLAHFTWREEQGLEIGSGSWWQLYEEGFAQYCENMVRPAQPWHQVKNNPDWLDWCRANRGWLAAEFLRRVDAGEPINPFFGSWFDLQGRKETGYFLGCEAVQHLVAEQTLEKVALLMDPELVLRPIIERWAEGKA